MSHLSQILPEIILHSVKVKLDAKVTEFVKSLVSWEKVGKEVWNVKTYEQTVARRTCDWCTLDQNGAFEYST